MIRIGIGLFTRNLTYVRNIHFEQRHIEFFTCNSWLSCWMSESRTDCERGHGESLNMTDISTSSHVYTTTERSLATRAWENASSMLPIFNRRWKNNKVFFQKSFWSDIFVLINCFLSNTLFKYTYAFCC